MHAAKPDHLPLQISNEKHFAALHRMNVAFRSPSADPCLDLLGRVKIPAKVTHRIYTNLQNCGCIGIGCSANDRRHLHCCRKISAKKSFSAIHDRLSAWALYATPSM